MPKISAPDFGGTWSWEGKLTPSTKITLANGFVLSFSALITQTNGDALVWWEEQQEKSVDSGDDK